MPLLPVVCVAVIVPLVMFKPLLAVSETPVTALLVTASLIVPEIVPDEQLSGSIIKVETISVWLSPESVADWISSK